MQSSCMIMPGELGSSEIDVFKINSLNFGGQMILNLVPMDSLIAIVNPCKENPILNNEELP